MDKTKLSLNAPFAKTVETEDGGREVWGFATLERVDKSKEIADFDGTVKAFEKWANETEKRTGGKSKGNVRLMHQPIAVGKTIHWEPSETTIEEDGVEKVVKGIWVGAYIPPTKEDVIKDIDEGILSAFSIGGAYEKRWWDPDEQAFRYVPSLSEYSLVDNPACEGADIVNVISKAGGPWQKENNMGEELKKSREAKGSFEELRSKLYNAVESCEALMGEYCWCDCSIVATYPDNVVVYEYRQGKYFKLPYSFDGENVIVGDPVEVAQTYIPLEATANEEAMKASRNMFLEKAIESFNQKADPEASEMGEQLAKNATSLKGGDYIYKNGKVLEKKEDEQNAMNPEQLVKAAEAAGLSMEQITAFFKAISSEEVQKTSVPVVDGDGDKDNNSAFPNNPDDKINIEGGIASVKAAEEEVKVKESPSKEVPIENGEATSKAAEGELAKAGKSISKQNGTEIAHAVGHLAAVQKGTTYSVDDHLQLEAAGQGGTGEEAPAVDIEKMFTDILSPIVEAAVVKTVEAVVAKSVEASLQKSAGQTEQLESLVKGLASQDELKKTMTELEEIKVLVKEIHETPQAGGPALNGAMMKGFNVANIATQENSTLEKFVSEITDPMLKDRVGQEIAMRKAKEAFK